MSRKKTLLASSLSICSASASMVVGTDQHPVYAEGVNGLDQTIPPKQDVIAQEVLYHYLNPIKQVAEGNLAAKVETKPLSYQIEKGDTLYKIGLFYGVPHTTLAIYNQISSPEMLIIGDKLNIPITKKWVRLKVTDTLESLTKEYHTTKELLLHLNPILEKTDITYSGQMIAVPQKLPVSEPKVVKPPVQLVTSTNASKDAPKETGTKKAESPKKVSSTGTFKWPVSGQITSNFGWRNGRQHKGIDVWSSAKAKAVIYAADGGVVTKAGYSGAYGNLVVIDHGNGWQTYYAHLSRLNVSKGQSVSVGQSLGNMGQTGNATGYHLHFEVRKNGNAINPLSVLK
ncbi:M23 family metallopeptidase [Hazenella sp. IB182357]|uniref:M23 family metallopeptidase n=1 Tax=Polycladospora coralii TaxID=2771432 RepID=A0A926N5U1_9BACL|nr:M23 family metallopeptidase [Polycladospora coralii]MBD1372109.1 M23 family metallopeptidase [Polycladospora coralii]MBS7530615.1 M23 family metallopeptidase [Polycladospora coralii]